MQIRKEDLTVGHDQYSEENKFREGPNGSPAVKHNILQG